MVLSRAALTLAILVLCWFNCAVVESGQGSRSSCFAISPNNVPKTKKTCSKLQEQERSIEQMTTSHEPSTQQSARPPTTEKRIVFIRHGCTYMNEYLATSGSEWGDPNFTDVFPENIATEKYKDSPLSPKGVRQAEELSQKLKRLIDGHPEALMELDLSAKDRNVAKELDLVIASPLTRALKTMEIALLPHIQPMSPNGEANGLSSQRIVPVVASPLATERVYLISDIGKTPTQLHAEFGHFVDFKTGFQPLDENNEEWWFSLGKVSSTDSDYVEWRPNGQGQSYACPGEPDSHFHQRMLDLYYYLGERPESTIAVVCHWGVIDWMLGEQVANCALRVVAFSDLRPKNM